MRIKAKKKSYDKEFKIRAVKLYLSSGRSGRQLSRELGIAQTLKTEHIYFEHYETPEQAKLSTFEYIEVLYLY